MIETKRLFIRQFLPSDFNDLYEYLSDPSIYVYEPGEPISLDASQRTSFAKINGKHLLGRGTQTGK